jgi:hypothetical protein
MQLTAATFGGRHRCLALCEGPAILPRGSSTRCTHSSSLNARLVAGARPRTRRPSGSAALEAERHITCAANVGTDAWARRRPYGCRRRGCMVTRPGGILRSYCFLQNSVQHTLRGVSRRATRIVPSPGCASHSTIVPSTSGCRQASHSTTASARRIICHAFPPRTTSQTIS